MFAPKYALVLIGWLAQLVEHFAYTEDVTGSSPVPPTKFCHDT